MCYFFFFVLFCMCWRWSVNICVFIQLEILKTNKQTNKQRRCGCSVTCRRQGALLPPLSLQADKECSPAAQQQMSESSWRWAAHRRGSTFCVVKLLFFSRHSDELKKNKKPNNPKPKKLRVWMKRAPRAACRSWLDSDKRNETATTSESDLRGQVSLSTEITWIIFVWHDMRTLMLCDALTPAGREKKQTVDHCDQNKRFVWREAAWMLFSSGGQVPGGSVRVV